MSKHTPGEWRAEQPCAYGRDIYSDNIWVGQANNDHDQPDSGDFPTNSECEANANLIAAAPDLLVALEDMLVQLREKKHTCTCFTQEAEAAIAKAKP